MKDAIMLLFSLCSILLASSCNLLSIQNFYTTHSSLNQFGISTRMPNTTKSFKESNKVFAQRIDEEMGQSLNVEIIEKFIPKIQNYINYLMNQNNLSDKEKELARLAIIDIVRAKKMLRPNTVDPKELAQLRRSIEKIQQEVDSFFDGYSISH